MTKKLSDARESIVFPLCGTYGVISMKSKEYYIIYF